MSSKTSRKLKGSIGMVVFLTICLCVTSFALMTTSIHITNNYFASGNVGINLNDGKEVISESEFLFEPGMVVEKDFFLENNSTWGVYYKLYFDNVSGDLADVLDIRIKDGDTVLYSGKISDLGKEDSKKMGVLEVGQRLNLKIYFKYPENYGNSTQGMSLTFNLCADAVQTKNNVEGVFN